MGVFFKYNFCFHLDNELPANREGGFRSEPSTYNELPLNGNDGYEELALRAPPTVGGYQPGLVNNNNNNNDMYPSDVLNAARATNQSFILFLFLFYLFLFYFVLFFVELKTKK